MMPKVITYSADSPTFLQMLDGNEYLEGDLKTPNDAQKNGEWLRRGVHIGWVKGRNLKGSVEIGVAAFDLSKESPRSGTFTSLDRDAVNRLIRSLRTARDQAFGKDA